MAESPAGQAQCEATLTVVEALEKEQQKAPEFIIKLSDKSVNPKEKVTFECKVEPPQAQVCFIVKSMIKFLQTHWLKDNKPIEESPPKVKIEKYDDGTQRLTIEQVEMDEGNYKCVAQNEAGKTETSANLTIKSK